MKVKKILNNNVIVTNDSELKEVIVMGKGLAFGLRSGDDIDESRIDKIFSLKNSQETSKFSKLLAEVPLECLEITEQIVDYAKEELGKKLHNSIYITLTDHINTMIERAKLHAYIKNTMLWDVKRLYRNEFAVARRVVDEINDRIGSVFDDNEAASIALHFVNAELEMDFTATMNITKVITEILNIIKYNFRITYDEDSLSYYRFIIHLRFFAQRLFSETTYDDTYDLDFLQHIGNKYSESYHCAQLVKKYVFNAYQYNFSDEECMYLTIHIEKVIQDSNKL